jgi:phospholipase C
MKVAVLAAVGMCAQAHEIENVVVMMLENRAFDHMLGYMQRGGPFGDTRVDGIAADGEYCNPLNVSDLSRGQICVNDTAQDHCAYDPDHSFAATTERIFGCTIDVTAGTPCTNFSQNDGNATMIGFVAGARSEVGRHGKDDGANEMMMWPSEKVPVITTLAKEYALFDRFFASHPGSTYPNRQFVLSGTARGMTDTGNQVPKGGFPQKTVLRMFEEAGLDWRMYYEDSLAWAIFMTDVQNASSQPNIINMTNFYADAKSGDLANFTFLEPRIAPSRKKVTDPTYGLANHQHPTSSVREGERWIKNVYEALRNGPRWNNTLLIVTYDEHGGFYDHVPPPQVGVPNPDGICGTAQGFTYERLGVRIPTIAVSPWIAKATLVHEAPTAQKPQPTSQYELSSIPATLRTIFPQLGAPLTARTAWAATFEHLFGDELRTDAPLTLPDVPPPPTGELERQLDRPIDEHANGLITILCHLNEQVTAPGARPGVAAKDVEQAKCGAGVETYHDFAPWMTAMWDTWRDAVAQNATR